MTAGRGPQRGQVTARTEAGVALLGRAGPAGVAHAGRGVPSGPSAPPPVEEVQGPVGPGPAPGPGSAPGRGAGPGADGRASPAELRRAHRHCWVLPDEDDDAASGEAAGEPFAGVVAEWRPTPTGWLARVVYALGDDETASVVESWLAAEQLLPA